MGDLAKNSTLLVIIGKLLLLHHDHPLRSGHQKNYDREEDVDFGGGSDSVFSSVTSKDPEWWWETLLCLRENLLHLLTRSLCRTEDQVLREFSINLLYYLSAADSSMTRLIALHNNSLILLVSFVEQAEANPWLWP